MGCKRFKCYQFDQIATSSLLIFRYEEDKYEKRCSRQSTRQIQFFVKMRGKFSFAEAQGKLRVIGFEIEEKLFFQLELTRVCGFAEYMSFPALVRIFFGTSKFEKSNLPFFQVVLLLPCFAQGLVKINWVRIFCSQVSSSSRGYQVSMQKILNM